MSYLKDYNIIKKHFHTNGWVLVKKIFSRNEVTEINKKIDIFLKKNIKKYEGKSVNFIGNKVETEIKNINSFHSLSDSSYIKKKSENKKITNIVKKLRS